MRFLIAAPLLFSACGPAPDCVTSQGVELYGDKDCSPFEYRLARGIDGLSPLLQIDVARRINGWKVIQKKTDVSEVGDYFLSDDLPEVGGETDCLYSAIIVGWGSKSTWQISGLVHEMVHASTFCTGGNSHTGWREAGLFDAIYKANMQ